MLSKRDQQKFIEVVNFFVNECNKSSSTEYQCKVFFQMFHYLDETFEIWYNINNLKNAIKKKLDMVVNFDNQPKHYIDYYLNLQCKFGFRNYCVATTQNNIRCRHIKMNGLYCNLHYKLNKNRKKCLNKLIIKDVSDIIIQYL